ncbi:MAG: hypothetical protein IJ060_12205 [Oscillospiraceae bacterium]|nr:hypothetical protein [Oscillospiraceae bacterium]
MYTSDDRSRVLHYVCYDLIAAAFFALFGAVYEHFSHEVYSYAMIYAFAVPLIAGALPLTLLLCRKKPVRLPGAGALVLWHAGLASFTVGLVFRGVLEIYGTTNRLMPVYPAAGGILIAAALLAYLIGKPAVQRPEVPQERSF